MLVLKAYLRWFRIIGIVLFIWIASQIDWMTVWQLHKDVQPGYVLGYFVVFVVAALLKVVRLRWFLNCMGYHIGYKAVYKSVVESAFFGMVTPARVGEFTKVFYLIRFGLTQRQTLAVVFMERFIDFMVLLIASIVGSLYFFTFVHDVKLVLAILIMFIMCLIVIFNREMVIRKCLPYIIKLWSRQVDQSSLNSMVSDISRFFILAVKVFLPVSIVVLLLSYLQLWFLAQALEIRVSGLYLGLAYTSSSLVSLLPISIAGLGTREAIYITLLAQQGITSGAALAISLLDGIIFSMLAQAFLTIPLWFMSARNEQI